MSFYKDTENFFCLIDKRMCYLLLSDDKARDGIQKTQRPGDPTSRSIGRSANRVVTGTYPERVFLSREEGL